MRNLGRPGHVSLVRRSNPMRIPMVMLALLLVGGYAQAQDDSATQAMQAAQQATQQSQQAAMDTMRQASEASAAGEAMRESMDESMANADNAQLQRVCCLIAAMPKFSLKAGKFATPPTVRITDAT